jgi:AcrR family transcriptional regulator
VVRERSSVGGSGSETRARILTVALELFAGQGYAGTSIRDIAEAMGVTKAALYYHFASKEEILDAVTEPMSSDFRRLAERAGTVPSPPAADLIAGLVDILSRRAALIRTVMADPSVPHGQHRPEMLEQMQVLVAAIAADPTPAAQMRARCALGAAQFASFSTAMQRAAGDPRYRDPPDRRRSEQLLEGTEHLLADEERAEIVAAAMRALTP